MPQATPAPARRVSRSPSSRRDSSATAAGIAAIAMPAATAEVSATPLSMQTEKRKLPKKLSQNSSQRSRLPRRGSPGVRRSQPSIATAAMPKRSQASSSTGNSTTSAFDSAT